MHVHLLYYSCPGIIGYTLTETAPAGSDVDVVSIYDLLSFAEFYLGNTKSAAMYTEQLLQHCTYVDTHYNVCR